MPRKLSLALGLVVLCSLTISGGRKPKLAISFHIEGQQLDGPKMVQPMKLGNPAKVYFFRKAPELTERHIQGYYPFLANDGSSFGAAFKLNQHGSDILTTISTISQGRKLLTVLDAEPVDFIVLDKPIRDGYIVCWGGLTKADLAKFDTQFQRIQEDRNSSANQLVPERATTPMDTRPPPPITVDDPQEAPKKQRWRPFNRNKGGDS